ncbi:glycosyltransferase [Chitinophaga lutea]
MKTRIAFISEHASPLAALGGVDAGGQNVYVGELARQVARKGFSVDIFTRRENDALPRCVQWSQDVRIIHIDAGPPECIEKEKLLPYMADFRDDMLRFIREENIRYHLLHANFFMSALVAVELKPLLHVPFVVTFHALGRVRKIHQGEDDRFPPERMEIEAQVIREADMIIAECPQDRDDLLRLYDAQPEKITIAPCGVNPDEMFPVDKRLARRHLKLPEDETILLQLGRMVPRKGVDNVIEALGRLPYTGRRVRLIIVGGEAEVCGQGMNPEIARLKKIAREAGVQSDVTFAGRRNRDELKYYYAAADLFITTPWYEPFGITPLESMACGTPVVGAAVGGIRYSVVDGETGVLVPPRDPEALAAQLHRLLSAPEQLRQMGEKAIRRVQSLFTWQHVARKMVLVYENVITRHSIAIAGTVLDDLTLIDEAFDGLETAVARTRRQLRMPLRDAARLMCRSLLHGKKIMVCGNGGSAAESQHFAAELTGRFEIPHRQGLPAISLTADSALLTAWANDTGFDDVFARQVEALGKRGDILLCLSTSGQSPNILKAMEAARRLDITCIAMLGKDGGEAAHYADLNIVVPSNSTLRIQEMQLMLLHTLCQLIEHRLFATPGPNGTLNPKKGAAYAQSSIHR